MKTQIASSFSSYRLWPLLFVSISRTFYFSIFAFALPNYLIYQQGIPPSLLGTILASYSIAYIFGPIFNQWLCRWIPLHRSILLSSIASVVFTGIQLFSVNPVVLITIRILDGLFLGLFWPNMIFIVSQIQNYISPKQAQKNFRRFNQSWNIGLIAGYLVGFLLVLIWKNDYLALQVSFGLSFILIGFSLWIENPAKFQTSVVTTLLNQKMLSQTDHISPPVKMQVNSGNNSLAVVPIIISWLGILFFASSKAVFNFLLPYILKNANYSSDWVYFVVFFQQILQMTALTWIPGVQPKNQLKIYLGGIVVLTIISGLLHIIQIIPLILIMFGISGGLFGTLQGVTSKIMLDLSAEKKNPKYSNINEILSGATFGIAPLLAGFIAETHLSLNYTILFSLGLITIICVVLILHFSQGKDNLKNDDSNKIGLNMIFY